MSSYSEEIKLLEQRLLYVQSTATIDIKSEELANRIYEQIQQLEKRQNISFEESKEERKMWKDELILPRVKRNRYGLDNSISADEWSEIRKYTPESKGNKISRQIIAYRSFIVNHYVYEVLIWANYEDSSNTYKIPRERLFKDKKLRAFLYKYNINERENLHWPNIDDNILEKNSIVLGELKVLLKNLKNEEYIIDQEFSMKIPQLNIKLIEALNLIVNNEPYKTCGIE